MKILAQLWGPPHDIRGPAGTEQLMRPADQLATSKYVDVRVNQGARPWGSGEGGHTAPSPPVLVLWDGKGWRSADFC